MVRDNDLDKWIYKEHTRVKHELLDKYLGGWLSILGQWHRRLIIVDGFAGRGEYADGSEGSPIIILRKAAELIKIGRVGEVVCAFVEKDAANYANLEDTLRTKVSASPGVKIYGPVNDSFENTARGMISSVNGHMAPSFWFIDPFGFTGMSFDILREIMALSRSEVFITLMLRDIGRFLSHPDLDATFDRLFGTREWRTIVYSGQAGETKEKELLNLYVAQLRSIGCKVTFFRVCMDEKVQTLYYMVHATKHARGRLLMKDVVHGQGANGIFAYLGPQDEAARLQGTLLHEDPIPALKESLLVRMAGRTASFEALRNECCDDDELRDPEYRAALKELIDDGRIKVKRVPTKTPTGRAPRGLRQTDEITFPPI